MKTIKVILILTGALILLMLAVGCSPSDVATSSLGGVTPNVPSGGGTPAPTYVTVSFTTAWTTTPNITTANINTDIDIHATVRDQNNNLMSGVTVSFSASTGAGSFVGATTATTSSGIATVMFTTAAVATPAIITATVFLADGTSINNNASFTVGVPPVTVTPTNVNLTVSPLSINVSGQVTVTVTATDANGNPAYNTPITLDFQAGSSLGGFSADLITKSVSTNTNASGQHSVIFYAGSSSGTATLRVTATAPNPDIVKTAGVEITSVPSNVALTVNPLSMTVAATANITAVVTNSFGQAVPDGTNVSLSCISGNCAVGTFPALITTVSGTATGTFTAHATNFGSIVLRATSGSATDQAIITVLAADTSSIEFVSADLPVIGIAESGPNDHTKVTFLVKDANGVAQAGIPVDFQLFGPTGSYIGSGTTDAQSSGLDGKVFTILHAGLVAGPARIVATVSGSSPVISTSSGNISIGGGVPSDLHFDLAATKLNIEGFGYNNILSTISAYVADRFGNYNVLEGTSVSFSTEAGAMDTSNTTDENGLTNSIFRTQDPRPKDVEPETNWGEPYYVYTDVISGVTRTYNPRDGWVTIVATTTGEETYDDENSNGFFDAGDTYTNIGEPFIDSDDDGVRDAGELVFDWPSYVPLLTGCTSSCGIGKYDTGNSQWDGKIPIWKTIKLVFTGAPDMTSSTEYAAGKRTSRIELSSGGTGSVTIPYGSMSTFNVYVSDINMNTLIGGTSITVKLADGSAGTQIGAKSAIVLADTFSRGPSVIPVSIANAITQSTDQYAFLETEVTWNGIKYSFSYPGTIKLTPPVTITTTALAAGTVGTAYNQSLSASGGTTPYTWQVAAGALPPGLTPLVGRFITGTPDTAGTYNFTIEVEDSLGEKDTKDLSITIAAMAVPAAPTGVTATASGAAGSGEITVTWSPVTGAASYNIYWDDVAGITTGDTKITGASSGDLVTGPTGSTTYIAVTAVNAGGESALSTEVSAMAP